MKNIITISDFQKDFNLAFEEAVNKEYLINNELREINNLLDSCSIRYGSLSRRFKNRPLKRDETQVFKFSNKSLLGNYFLEAYNSHLINGTFNPEKNHQDTEESYKYKLEVSEQAFEFVKYYNWLNELLKNTSIENMEVESISLKQKLLILHYLGLDLYQFNKTKYSLILSRLFDKHKSNVRTDLGYLLSANNEGKIKTSANLSKMLEVFEGKEFTKAQIKIKKDIEKFVVSD
jgi:hypothetical protein